MFFKTKKKEGFKRRGTLSPIFTCFSLTGDISKKSALNRVIYKKLGIQRSFLICKTLPRIFPFIELEAFYLGRSCSCLVSFVVHKFSSCWILCLNYLPFRVDQPSNIGKKSATLLLSSHIMEFVVSFENALSLLFFFFFHLVSFIYGLLIQPYRVILICLSFSFQLQAIKLDTCTVAVFSSFLCDKMQFYRTKLFTLTWTVAI